MIEFFSETSFQLDHANAISTWLADAANEEGCTIGDLDFVFCDDAFLHQINLEFLNHDTFTDVITFDYSLGNQLNGEIYISIDRVAENALNFKASFMEEVCRVMVHGLLHLCGYQDKSAEQISTMRVKEDQNLARISFLFA
ncbi:MAG TPA: rRNA maturation RNase YbeY [Flavobacteriaceae bacterium]|nr:rRNA maturation RNase YbeY [Flavobacteriaceae bacterium]MCB9211938.1 rRNA maturation RNase YbeY [Alteromonas sp.]HPF09968.1 rRNA maturation RNase YbeY [Flavobacteriaceae bacterium]HQU20065.1 rRNA maturation RNase YbeY [Flavobacteriaceae bacterium]HQU63949.1 rRNA maturation RNase YbeY [Flavobacteriaceae bacterium]